MPANPPNPAAVETLVLSGLVLALAAFLGIRQGIAIRHRDPERLGEADARQLSGRDRGRWAVALVLALIGLAMLGSTAIPVRQSRQAARLWAGTWMGILVLTLVLLALALADWLVTASEARRQARGLAEERRALLGEILRARSRANEDHQPEPPIGRDE